MAYFPKEQSNPITNMVAELNQMLQGQYFNIVLSNSGNKVLYNLSLTQLGLNSKKYLYVTTPEGCGLKYQQMLYYMQGILAGLRAGLEK